MNNCFSVPELRAVLLGNSWSDKSLLVNLLLGENMLSTEEELNIFTQHNRKLNETEVVLVNSPDLLHPNMTTKEHIEKCIEFSIPGPHVFLLILQPENFTEEHTQKLESFLQHFSYQSFKHSLVVIKLKAENSDCTKLIQQNQLLTDTIKKCKAEFLWEKDLKQKLLSAMVNIVKENNGDYLSLDIYKEPTHGIPCDHKQARTKLNQGGLVSESLNPVKGSGKYKNM